MFEEVKHWFSPRKDEGLLLPIASTQPLPGKVDRIHFGFNMARVPDKGEDADPIFEVINHDSGLLGVFDGVGGAGSTTYDVDGQTWTGARVASRLARQVVMDYFARLKTDGNDPLESYDGSELRTQLSTNLQQRANALDTGSSSRLKSKLIKRLPTTVAVIYFKEGPARAVNSLAIWAGDSRCYSLDPDHGLQQLTTDDIKSAGDALENLKNDSVLSNYINADTEFRLNERRLKLTGPTLLIAATDGCFAYFFTPAHFEYLLLQTLEKSSCEDEWCQFLTNELQMVAGDDASLAITAVGWRDFSDLKLAFERRGQIMQRQYIQPLDELSARLTKLEQERKTCERDREVLREQLWENYKKQYAELLAAETNKTESFRWEQ